jgi:hypothetical protein
MYGGLTFILLIDASATTLDFFILANPNIEPSTWIIWLLQALVDLMSFVLPILFLIDGFRRTNKTLK